MHEPRTNPEIKHASKDSVFCDLFSQRKYLLELYQALHPEDAEASKDDLELVTIERVVTDGEYNDIGFTVSGRLLVLVEAQTTWSANIVTRMLLYLAETFRRDLFRRSASLHKIAPVEMPTPELYVVYPGARDIPDKVSFRRDVPGGKGGFVDAEVHVLRGGANDIVGQYVAFTRVVDEVRTDESVASWDKAREVVRRCAERGILKEYMEKRQVEVEGIMFTLFDQERETELYHRDLRKQAIAEGRAEGRAEGIDKARAADVAQLVKSLNLSVDQAMEALAIPAEERERIADLSAMI